MVIFITGASHTGKTLLAQKLLERYRFPYLSIDHLKMGLIRSGQTSLTPSDDNALTEYLWPIVREMVKTALENNQNLIVEGCYIPGNWKNDFPLSYLKDIRYYCLVFSPRYIETHFEDIRTFANAIESRLDDSDYTKDRALAENAEYLQLCEKYGNPYVFIEENYETILKGDFDL